MNYPLISEYIEAIKSAEENFDQLRYLRPVLDENEEPVISSGNFAVVFKMKDIQTGKLHAVKCFLKEQEGRSDAYNLISEELAHITSSYLIPIKYLEKDLFVDSSNTEETEFPVLLMDWVEGETLDKYVLHNKYDGYKLSKLVRKFHKLSIWLLTQSFAHGDLKPDNIIVTDDGNLVMIDYDGMFVPKMEGQVPRELGTPNYRKPFRDKNCLDTSFSKRIDDFAIIHILLSLRVYSLHPQLINTEKDFALFESNDFNNIYNTPIYQEIISYELDASSCILISLFQKLIYTGEISENVWENLCFEDPVTSFVDLEESMCSLDNIVMAVELAYSSMLYKDPARNEFCINEYKNKERRICLAIEIQDNLKMHEWPYNIDGIKYSCLKPNGKEKREGVIFNLEEYTLRYLFGVVKYMAINKVIPKFVYGGGDDVFTLNNDEYKYEKYLDDFVKVQEESAEKYKYLYVFDIRHFFSSVNMSKLKTFYFSNDFTNVEWYENLFSKIVEKSNIQGLNPCSEIDFFFANLYLKALDERLSQYDNIKYFRYGDDIRIFANDKDLQEPLKVVIESVLSSLLLDLNYDKTKLIDTRTERIELAKACFAVSSRLYFGSNQAVSLLNCQNLAEIIENDLTTTYIFKLLNSYGQHESHIDDMFYLLRYVHKNSALYKKVTEYILDAGIGFTQDPMMFSYVLKTIVEILYDENVEPFVKYWILRTYFCSGKQYYKEYTTLENGWKDQSWYPKPCYMNQIFELLNTKFRKESADKLLCHLSDYIISVIEPFEKKVDDLPF